jgi:hypothetical protein
MRVMPAGVGDFGVDCLDVTLIFRALANCKLNLI